MAPAANSVCLLSVRRLSTRWLTILGLLMLAAVAGWAQDPKSEPAPGAKNGGSKSEPERKPKIDSLDKLKVPPGAIVVVCEEVEKAFRLVPKAVLLSPEKFKQMQEEIAELKRKLKPDAPASPSTCVLKVAGPLEEDLAHLEAEFEFKAEKDRTLIALGCQGAHPREPKLDGQDALLESEDDGFVIQVDAGKHTLKMKLDVPVGPRGPGGPEGGSLERGFQLKLPRAAVTSLELEQLPEGVKEVRVGELAVRKTGEAIALGAVDRLSLSWKKPVVVGTGPPLTAEGQITVQVQEKYLITEATLKLQDQRGRADRWVIQAPPQATLDVKTRDEHVQVAVSFDQRRMEYTLKLNQPTTQPLEVVVRARRPRTAGRLAIGPLRVLAGDRPGRVVRQQGTILVKAESDVHLGYLWPGEPQLIVSRREVGDDQRPEGVVAVFQYWDTPKAGGAVRPAVPLLELEAKAVKGAFETHVQHFLRVQRADAGWQVQATTTIEATHLRTGVGALEIQVPRSWPASLVFLAGWPRADLPISVALAAGSRGPGGLSPWPFAGHYQWEQTALAIDTPQVIDRGSRVEGQRLRLVLADKVKKKFTVTLKGVYTLKGGESQAHLELPHPLNTLDRGSLAEVRVPDDQELLPVAPADLQVPGALPNGNGAALGKSPTARGPALPADPHAFSLRLQSAVLRFAWQPYRPELPVAVQTDITLESRRARVHQRLQFPGAPAVPPQLLLRLAGAPPTDRRVEEALSQSLRVRPGGRLAALPARIGFGTWQVMLDPDKDQYLDVDYSFPVAASGRVQVPLLWLEQATHTDTKVRVWSEPEVRFQMQAALESRRWAEAKTEVIPERDGLPLLVLRGRGQDLPLTLRLSQATLPPLATVLVERALIRVSGTRQTGQTYTARYWISQWNTRTLDVALPGTGARLVGVRLGKHRLTPRQPDGGRKNDPAPLVRLDIPRDLVPRPNLLELVYEIPRAEPEGADPDTRGIFRNVRTTLYPPQLLNAVFRGRVYWQVVLPPGEVVLNPDSEATTEQQWGLRGWLPAPLPALSSKDLEHWLTRSAQDSGDGEPSLVCWQTTPSAIHLVHISQRGWLLGCSLLVLALGLGLSFVPLTRGPLRVLCWLVVTLIGLGAALTAFLWPSVMPAVFSGCLPGTAVLIPVVVVQWMLHRRYRRQLVFMPGFTRLKPGSSMVRAGSSNRPREASTVDVPPPGPDSSATKGGAS
jgi:hypothetical protein